MEIEAKFAIIGPLTADAISALDVSPYELRSAGVEEHEDILLDTPSRAITGARHALRIRTVGARHILTLKGPNEAGEGVHSRDEIEAPLAGDVTFDPTAWPADIRQRVLGLTRGEPLAPLLRNTVRRELWQVSREGREIGEVALDTGAILIPGRPEPIHELELELRGDGARKDLDVLRKRFAAALPLAPESRSKLERGLAALRHARWTLDGYTPLEAVARHTIHQHLRALRAAERLVVEQGDPDTIHDMRVATRRIRTTLQAFESAGVFPDKRLRSLRRRLKRLAEELGAVRDLDIFLAHKRDWVGSDDARESDLARMSDHLARERLAGYERVSRRIHRRKYAKLLADLDTFIATPAPAGPLGCTLVRHYAGSIIWGRYETLLRIESILPVAAPAQLHQARIAGKRLRYALEIFAPTLGDRARPMRKALVECQSLLGDIQDLTVALARVEHASAADPGNRGLRAYAGAIREERARLIERVPAMWAPLSAGEAREKLSRALAAL